MKSPPGSDAASARTWARALLVVLVVAGVLLAVVGVSGVQTSRTYRPTAAQAWPALENARSEVEGGGSEPAARTVHRVSASLLLAVAAAGVVAAIGWSVTARRRTWIGAVGLAALVLAAGYTGYLLLWDQLGLWAVTVGVDFAGVWDAAFSDQVRFIIQDGREVPPSQYRAALVAHLGAGTAAAVLVGLLVRAVRRGPRVAASPSASE